MVQAYNVNSNWRGKGNSGESHERHDSGGIVDIAPAKLCAALYMRKSDDSEGRSKSRDQQLEHCKLVARQLGIADENIAIYMEEEGQKGNWYWDGGSSRFPAPYRPELTRLMNDIDKIDIIIVWRSDRLYRDNGVCDAIMQVLRAKRKRLFMNKQEVDVCSSSGLYQAATEAANNRRWRDQISEDIQRDHQFKAELGMFTRNPSCVGFRSKGRGTQAVDPIWPEISLVTRVFRLFVDGMDIATGEQVGPLGTTGIAKYLMDQGTLWPKGQKGQKWKYPEHIHESQIRTVLTNCMYVARWRHNGVEYECDRLLIPERDTTGNTVPGDKSVTAIPISLYEAAQEKLAHQQGASGKRNRSSEHMLSGIAVCARCGRPLTVHFTAYKTTAKNKREPRRNFYCKHLRGTRPCPSGSARRIQEDILNAWVLEELAPLLALEIRERATASGREAAQQALAAAEARLREAKDRETKKLTAVIDVMDPGQFKAVALALRAEREAIERQVVELQKQVQTDAGVMPDLADPVALATMTTAALKDAIRRAVQWIAASKEGVTILTSWSTYIGARFREARLDEGETFKVTHIASVDVLSCLDCTGWLTAPEQFILGRRDFMGKRGQKLTDEEILPGFCVVDSDLIMTTRDAEMKELKTAI